MVKEDSTIAQSPTDDPPTTTPPQENGTTDAKKNDEGDDDTKSKATTSKSTSQKRRSNNNKSKKSKRRRRSTAVGNDSDTEQLKSRFLKRSSKNGDGRSGGRSSKNAKLETERGPVVKRKPIKARGGADAAAVGEQTELSNCTLEVANPSTYDKLFARLEETHFNKVVKPDGPALEKLPWICCFCQRKPCVDDLGDLFGPYYVKLTPPTFWPPFADKHEVNSPSPTKKPTAAVAAAAGTTEIVADLWFHGDCVYWSPGILLRGWGMTGLDEYLPKYWQQKCHHCKETGASISCSVKGCEKLFHFPCAVATGSLFKESSLAMYCEAHKKIGEKRK